ncbi:uncharacterized protein METZ01_LOCUS76937 [marine metagenome]|uniref:Uncharacterized protein n=1 Tax=marine metagenome TaxID=408172 RepID=A0A381UBV6_9ZZZZ
MNNDNLNSPIAMGFEEVTNLDLYLKIYGFNSYIEVKT